MLARGALPITAAGHDQPMAALILKLQRPLCKGRLARLVQGIKDPLGIFRHVRAIFQGRTSRHDRIGADLIAQLDKPLPFKVPLQPLALGRLNNARPAHDNGLARITRRQGSLDHLIIYDKLLGPIDLRILNAQLVA